MKLLVFAHTPPPHHGQSYTVQLLLEGLGGDSRLQRLRGSHNASSDIQCFHINARLSLDTKDIGQPRIGKVFAVLRYCAEAIWCRFRHGADAFYYIPAPALPSAIYRDWLVMLLCRPFFRRLIFHWEAAGLGEWLSREGSVLKRRISQASLGHPDLSIVLGEYNRGDAIAFESRQIAVVPNGIPDPCPNFEVELKTSREARRLRRVQILAGHDSKSTAADELDIFEVLYIGLCCREKGLFDALEGVVLLNQQREFPLKTRLTVAGSFWKQEEEAEFHDAVAKRNLSSVVRYVGFVTGTDKDKLFRSSDCLCFPTYYAAESFGLVLAEAMAYGLPIVTTNWRMIPELLPPDYPGIIPPQSPSHISQALTRAATLPGESLREHFLNHYTTEQFIRSFREALLALEKPEDRTNAVRTGV